MTERVVIAIIGSFPVAVVASVSLGLVISLGDAFSTIFFWIVWGASTFFSVRELEPKRVFGRTAIAYAIAAFSLLLTATVFAITAIGEVESSMAESEGAIEDVLTLLFGAAFLELYITISVIVGAFGLVTGVIAALVAWSLLKRKDGQIPEREDAQVSKGKDRLTLAPVSALWQTQVRNKVTPLRLGLLGLFLAVIIGLVSYWILAPTDASTSESRMFQTTTSTATPTSEPRTLQTTTPTAMPSPTATPVPLPPVPTPHPAAAPASPLPRGSEALFDAIWTGDIEAVQILVNEGLPVNVSDEDGDPLLHEAIWRNHPEIARILIDAGADVNAKDSSGEPMLYTAIWRGRIEALKILINAGADVNAKDSSGEPMLYTAIWRDRIEALKVLVDSGADVNARDSDDEPLLYTAVWRDKQEALKALVDAGADVNARRANGESLLYVARWRGKTEIEKMLVDAGATE